MATKRDIGSLANMPLSRHGGELVADGKQGDLTPLLQLAPDAAPVADLAPEIAHSAEGLVAGLVDPPAPRSEPFLRHCANRLRRFLHA